MSAKRITLPNEYPKMISYECTKKIMEQMERDICKIYAGANQGTGFFCKIPFPDQNKMLPVLITNNSIINNDLLFERNAKIKIDIIEEEEIKEIIINKNRMIYTNEEYDITIIEIKNEDNIKSYLELDDAILNDILNNKNKNKKYINETIYILQYAENTLSVSYGILDEINEDKKYNFNHKCRTSHGSAGSPILNLNNKIIGIYKENYNSNEQYNKGTFLNYPLKEFIEFNNKNNNEMLLKEFNNKYKLNIPDTKIDSLDLSYKKLGNEEFNDLCKINFKELKELDFYNNKISNINQLEKAKFNKLEILCFGLNLITDINILEKVNFKELKHLSLYHNDLIDINALEKVRFDKLEILDLNDNKISDINILEKVNFKELKELYLHINQISDIKILEKVNFDKLNILNLSNNKISDINALEKVNFKKLKQLDLSCNNITDIKVLEKVEFEQLEILILGYNKIFDINVFEKVNFKELKELDLYDNNISNIKALEKVKFDKIEKINLSGNKIDKNENETCITKLKSKIKILYV